MEDLTLTAFKNDGLDVVTYQKTPSCEMVLEWVFNVCIQCF